MAGQKLFWLDKRGRIRMSDALSYSVELAAEYLKQCEYLEKRLPGLYRSLLEEQLKMLGIKGPHSKGVVDSLASLKHDPRNILAALVVSGYKYSAHDDKIIDDMHLSSALYLLDAEKDTPNKYLDVFKKLKEKMDYKTVNVAHDQFYQVDKVYRLSKIRGDICKTIDVLAEIGYKPVKFYGGKRWLTYGDVDIMDKFTKFDVDNFLKAFRKLKEKLGYKSIRNSFGQINDILTISQILGYSKAIDFLAEKRGYKIRKSDINFVDIQNIKESADKLWEEAFEGFIPCLYKSSPVKFIEYFKGLGVEDKKVVIKSIFNCNEAFNDHGVVTWLDENYPELVREVGLSLV